jgi:hypothetical protein
LSFQKKKPYVPRIPFSEWYPKLKQIEVGRVFHAIRFIDKYDYYKELEMSGTEVDIYMSNSKETIARCRILGIGVLTFYDFTEKLVHADTYPNFEAGQLFGLLKKFYQGKDEWKNRDTRFIIIFLLPTEKTFEMNWEPTWQAGPMATEGKIKVKR